MASRVALAVDVLARDKASGTLRKIGGEADKTHRKFASFAGAMAGGALTAGVISFGKASVSAFKESEQAQAALNGAFAKFPKLADTNADRLGKLNAQMARKTIYDDDALASGQAVLAQFNLTGKQIEKITPLLADYASRTGQDIPSAATVLGKAFGGNAKALKSVGINYKSTGDAAKDFTNIQALLNAKVGGFAEREGKTSAGQAKILGNQYGEIQEVVGSKLVPALNSLSGKLLSVIDFTQRNSNVIKPLVITVGGFAAAVWGVNKAMVAWKATEKAFIVVKGLFTTAVVTEGTAAGTAAVEVGALATAETAAGAAGAGAALGIGAMAAAASAALIPLAGLLVAIKEARDTNALTKDLDALVAKLKQAGNVYDSIAAAEKLGVHRGSRPGEYIFDPNISANKRDRGVQLLHDAERFAMPTGAGTTLRLSPTRSPEGPVRHRAQGGNIEASRTYMVGEKGPELITPRRSGFVHTNRALMNLNRSARLDTSQISDKRRDPLRLFLTADTPRNTHARAPSGMRDYIVYTSLHLDGKRIATTVSRKQNARSSRGHLNPGQI